ncbi:lipase family protein [Amycolatopsis sp. QT-25]|uniref:lipase family protein n=1 Tax=Amycolatopsis sp. QT-25 TaxID=3034022 RepID=UPI0023EC37DE|nr:lipase family protein [Amycolatopsis sp. QT-25]WET78811.1 lipase family protein [Amycolatopsis sp. QT-25]
MTLRTVLVSALTAALMGAPAAQAAPNAPGDLVDYEPVVATAPAKAWKLDYRSTSATGQPNTVSGILLVPHTPWTKGARPLVSYAVGTHGLGDHCAPSTRLTNGSENEVLLMSQALSRGWAVVVTDYEGLGTPGTHTYAVGQSEGRAVLDAARAASNVPEAGLSKTGPVGVFGYSQGGQAAAFAGELQPSYAPDVNLVGVAEGGVPADLNAVLKFNDGGPAFGLVLGAAVGYATAYPELPFDDVLTAKGERMVARVKEACTVELGAAAPFARLNDFTTVPDVSSDPRWQARLGENLAGKTKPGAPVYLYHASLDELIPLSVGKGLRDRYRALGADVTWQEFPLLEHIGGVATGGPVAMTWLGTKF